jgi:hypothetical protein
MRCIRCGKEHKGIYGQRCEDCWAIAQFAVSSAESHGVPYVSGLGELRPRTNDRPSDPDVAALVSGAFAVA